jgi:glycosyltransferase involved in cell wall biosynthesis
LKKQKPNMYQGKKVVVVMPAYNAAKTLVQTFDEVMEQGVVDRVIVVDDASRDDTTAIAKTLPNVTVFTHGKNLGYGGNQKSCYRLAIQEGADIIIMVHPDSQYTPKLIPAMVSMIACGLYPCVLGSRILGGYALQGGDALVEIRGQPHSHGVGKHAAGGQALGISHGLPRIFARNPGTSPAGGQFE